MGADYRLLGVAALQVGGAYLGTGQQFGAGAGEGDLAVLQHIAAVGHAQGLVGVLLDEPSLGLAPIYIRRIFQIVKELNRNHGMTILLVEQNANQALRVADRGYVLQHGEITLAGTGAELLASPEVRAAYLEGGHA